ncbi:hypothetical protein DB347_06635 [Opitutaceae bacterium EW11]|nr:hypothetical protein DB347_06635 [Opitutaceae bacterium EW11]
MSTPVSLPVSRCLSAALCLLLVVCVRGFALPAFPGAEGFGANATGGRGGSVYVVTTLADSGPGSFRDAVSQPNRYVVFAVGGVIKISSRIVVKNNLTIAGQTAPGEGITIYGNGLSFSGASNTVTRYIRFRMGVGGDSGKDALGIANGNNLLFDHVTVSWGRDETFSINADDPANPPSNITLQDCMIEMGLQTHSAGGLMQTDGGVSIIRCLYIDNHTRNPKVKGVNEFINCVVYNWGGGGAYILGGDSVGQSYCNVVNNYFISGPNTTVAPFTRGNLNFHLYAAENYEDLNRNGSLDGAPIPPAGYTTVDFQAARYPYPTVARLLTPSEAYAHVLASAGASKVRDRVDRRYLAELTSLGTLGQIPTNENDPPIGGPGPVAGGAAPVDSDGDGMPDVWELAVGTNPAVQDHNGDANGDGYTNLEEYLNGLAPAAVQGVAITGIADDTGGSASDAITSDGTLVFQGTAEGGSTVTLTRIGSGIIGTATASPSGSWSFDYSAAALPEGVYAFAATAATPSGGSTPPTPAFLVRVDRTAPAAADITSVTLDSGSLVFNGASEPMASVSVVQAGQVVGAAVADRDGLWSASYSGPALAPGVYDFSAACSDAAGNAGPISASYRVDTAQPPPTLSTISSDTGVSAVDRITSDPTLVFSGSAAAGSTVTLSRVGTGVLGTAIAGIDGSWSFDYTATALPAGTHVFFATASAAGVSSPASAPAAVTVDGTAPTLSSILRQDPLVSAVVATQVVFRATFSEPVGSVSASAFQLTTTGTAAGTVSGVTFVDPATYDVTVSGIGGEGTLRLDLKAAAPGLTDVAGNAIVAGYTAGQSYTLRAPGSGLWNTSESGEVWSDPFNWEGGAIANGVSATADFSTLDVDATTTVVLDSPRTLGHLVFGDTDTASAAGWTLSDGGSASNTLTLSVNTGIPSITVNALGSGAAANVDVGLSSASGLEKNGAGIAVLTKPNDIAAVAVNRGTLRLASGGGLAVTAGTIGSSGASGTKLEVAQGGTFSASGPVQVVRPSGGSGVYVTGGAAVFDGGLAFANVRDGRVQVSAGTLTAISIDFPRSNDNSQAYSNGMFIQGGETTVGSLSLGSADSYATLSIEGGRLVVTGPLSVGFQKAAGARGGLMRVTGGTFVSANSIDGLILSRRNAGDPGTSNGVATFSGGTSFVEKLSLGSADTTGGTARLEVSGGALYLGSGGIERSGSGKFSTQVTLNSGVLGATADWSSSVPMSLGGAIVVKAADADGTPRSILLSGPLSGSGGLTKTGAGMLTLAGTTTFTGPVTVSEGALRVGGALAGPVVLSGGVLDTEGTGTLTVDNTVTFNGGGSLAFTLAESGDSSRLAIAGAFTKGASGVHTIVLRVGPGLAAGNTYTLATFGSTDFASSDFTVTGLPDGFGAAITITGTSLQITIVARPSIDSPSTATGTYGAAFHYTITATNGPTSFGASGLPAGLTVDTATGAIGGLPQAAGTFSATISASNLGGTATAPLQIEIAKAVAPVTLTGLRQSYDGTARLAAATTIPAGLTVTFAYDGGVTAPVYPGQYAVVATIQDANHSGSASGTLEITTTLLVRHAPSLNGDVEGSVQLARPESVSLNGGAGISTDLLVPGTPVVNLNGQPSYGGTLDAAGSAVPSNTTVTINRGSVLRHVVRRVDAVPFPTVSAPQAPVGTRDLTVNQPGQDLGDLATLRNLTLNRDAGPVVLPPGAYGNVTLNTGTTLVIGQSGGTEPAVYQFSRLTLNGNSSVQVVGPATVRLGESLQVNGGTIGAAEHPAWLRLELATSGVTLNSGSALHGEVLAPAGAVSVNRGAVLRGRATCDSFTVNGGGLLDTAIP